MKRLIVTMIVIFMMVGMSYAEQNFAQEVGSVRVGDAQLTRPLRVPCITFGADMATFYANGALRTKSGTVFGNLGLDIELYVQDDPYQQARDYMEGKTPFFRGTYRMCAIAAELFSSDARTKPYMILQKTFSLGDHAVGREHIKTIQDFKGAKVCLQAGGPHVGFLYDILKRANLTYNDITIVWAKNLMGKESPADMMRKDKSIDIAFVITPDMIGLTGGLQSSGSGAEGTIKGARVVVSTAEMNYSIADVYLVRKDFWDKNSDLVTKFVAGILKAQEEVIDLRKAYDSSGSKKFTELLQLTQDIYGKEAVPTLEEDAYGMLIDCTFVGHPGNVAFFTDKKNQHGFDVFQNDSLDMVISRGYAKVRQAIMPSPIDWNSSHFNFLTKKEVVKSDRFRSEAVIEEIEALSSGGALDGSTILTFAINFLPNQTEFSEVQYRTEYERVVDALGKFGNAVIAIRGHSDPTKMLFEVVQAGKAKGILRESGVGGNRSYSLDGRPLNLEETQTVVRLVEAGKFDGVADHNPRSIIQGANNLSRLRAQAVRDSVIKFAKTEKGLDLDPTQIQPLGVGVKEPFIAKPKNMAEAKQNMRVEFRLVRVTAEVMKESDFNF